MHSTFDGKKFRSMSSSFQHFVPRMKRSFTTVKDGSSWGDNILPPQEASSHRWFQILIDEPSPNLHLAPLQITSLACKMLFHAKEQRGLISMSKIFPLGKYFDLNILYSRVSFSWYNLQTYFPRSSLLNCLRSRKPIPPTNLGERKVLHLTHCIFLTLSWFPH